MFVLHLDIYYSGKTCCIHRSRSTHKSGRLKYIQDCKRCQNSDTCYIPLKDSSGIPVIDATVKFSAVKVSSTITGTVNEQTNSGTPTSGDVVKFDTKSKGMLITRGASASSVTQGTWGIRLYLEAPYGSHTLLVGPNNVDNSVKHFKP